ncbi:type 1 glutamine amidotransferase domain-containing protein [Flavivirga rizhaonensis]|uniref:Type 1 glutamine amidotransferase domain-containing protein n=1 Tax=Flavivirga rizhaonensis TaxID=2559571 RepID=A0A4S1E2H4_9FLAO|nr:type 1 glutamine amidotransferase domain-containing protein [Flavivirga rizhaonensis]TGV04729.1 type 1 glutamine amidotransferase domain-containing protein [Flavivirga rizhaonensis]
MKKVILLIVTSILISCTCGTPANKKKRVLVVLSNTVNMGDSEKHEAGNNLWEVAPPYHIFVSHGYEVDFVSPTGKDAPFTMEPIGISSYTMKYENFTEKANNSFKPNEIDPNEYEAVFVGGGYGSLFDVVNNDEILSILASVYDNNGVIGGCGHGPGAFANVKLRSGAYMIKGKKVTGFPNSTEITKSWAMQGTLLPETVEDLLRKNGALFQSKKDLKDKYDVVIDKRIVTTMFLPSAAIVAKEMINLMK